MSESVSATSRFDAGRHRMPDLAPNLPGLAMRLRAPALRALARLPLTALEAAQLNDAPDEAWSLFLEMEACALPLVRRLPSLLAISAVQRAVLHESRRVLAARAARRIVTEVCASLGTTGFLMKSGPLVHDDAYALTSWDLDLLVPASRAAAVQAALVARGYGEFNAVISHHRPRLRRVGALDLEVHTSLRSRAIPDPQAWFVASHEDDDAPILRAPPAAPHAAFVLEHARQMHPERRGRLRDIELLRTVLAEAGGWEAVTPYCRWPDAPRDRQAVERQLNGEESALDRQAVWARYVVRSAGLVLDAGTPQRRAAEGLVGMRAPLVVVGALCAVIAAARSASSHRRWFERLRRTPAALLAIGARTVGWSAQALPWIWRHRRTLRWVVRVGRAGPDASVGVGHA